MITQQQLFAVSEQLPERFSIGELVDKLIGLAEIDAAASPAPGLTTKFANAVTAAIPPALASLYGSVKLRPEDEHKSYEDLRWEAMQEKYGL